MQVFINTYGTYLHVKEEMFEIRTRTAPKEKFTLNHIAAHKVSSFIVSKGSSITTDAIALALKHNIDIVVVENDGHPMGQFWHSKLGSTTKIRKRQLEASLSEEGWQWVQRWISRKLENQADYLQDLKKHRAGLATTLADKQESILGLKEKIEGLQLDGNPLDGNPSASGLLSRSGMTSSSEVADTLRGWEGNAGRHYFEALGKAIPAEFAFQGRSFRPAQNTFNAMLNYAYGILYSRVERALMLAGIDPYVGFLHRDDYNMKSMVFDFIEPYRIYAERCVFTLFSTKKVKKSFCDEIAAGCSLNAEGKPFVVEHFMQYLDGERIRYQGRNQTRYNALQMDAHQFANALINSPTPDKL